MRLATSDGSLARDVQQKLQGHIQAQHEAIETERRALPKTIATLSAEGRNLVETLGQVRGTAHRLLEDRIEDIGEQLAAHESRLVEVQRALAALDQTEVETRWVVESLTHFDAVWDAMSQENRGRLVHAIVEKVEVDERSGQVTAVLVDLGQDDDLFQDLTATEVTNEEEAQA